MDIIVTEELSEEEFDDSYFLHSTMSSENPMPFSLSRDIACFPASTPMAMSPVVPKEQPNTTQVTM